MQRPADMDEPEWLHSRLFAPHIESFNFFLQEGLNLAVADMDATSVQIPDGPRVTAFIDKINFHPPMHGFKGEPLKPRDCRLGKVTYAAEATATIGWQIEGDTRFRFSSKSLGRIPIMVRSKLCRVEEHLRRVVDGVKKDSAWRRNALTTLGEDTNDMGGFFIINGNEKLVRLLIVQRRNFPMAFIRDAYEQTAPIFTKYACVLRCVRPDQTSHTVSVHYLIGGNMMIRFAINRKNFFIPAIALLKALRRTTDREIYSHLVQGREENTMLTERVMELIRSHLNASKGEAPAVTQEQCLALIGRNFRTGEVAPEPDDDDVSVGRRIIRKFLFVHCKNDDDKFHALLFSMRKLYALVDKEIEPDNAESVCNQEILLPGHVYTAVFKDKVQEWLNSMRFVLQKMAFSSKFKSMTNEDIVETALSKLGEVGSKMNYFLSTGNITAKSGLDFRQKSGFSIMAERLNFLRYISHYRSVHRGQFYTEMRTTAVRKLLPDSWGYLCPVHTPDGAPCGLLNHLASPCEITQELYQEDRYVELQRLLTSLGVREPNSFVTPDFVSVFCDGIIMGYVQASHAQAIAETLRKIKVTQKSTLKTLSIPLEQVVPYDLEVCFIPPGPAARQYPALYIFVGPTRMIRPVWNKSVGKIEYIGGFEQPYLGIDCDVIAKRPPGVEFVRRKTDLRREALFTHAELSPNNIFSVAASLTPFSDFNQSPRNMYQCQMGKQTMGTPTHAFKTRTDNKMYRIATPQTPIAQTLNHRRYGVDQYAQGTNAVIAVLSYTGFDMEDAMCINKSAYERGFGFGTVLKADEINLSEKGAPSEGKLCYFSNTGPDGTLLNEMLDEDGLPQPGDRINEGDPLYSYFDESTGKHTVIKYKYREEAIIDDIVCCGFNGEDQILNGFQRVIMKYRMVRRPARGDKFSSRHGQKGVMSVLYPQVDMPFSSDGLTPDVIINPNAFPSRMTVGMLVEIMAGKAGAIHGTKQDATTFTFDEEYPAHHHFGQQLAKAGYNYYGNELLYSGVTGEPFWAEIYFGVCYYQRLRHMVGDKYQVRSLGPRVPQTHQPVKGRKKGGGTRFGEMERDSLLAHGVSTMLKDRLLLSSDMEVTYACSRCGSFLPVWPRLDDGSHTNDNHNHSGPRRRRADLPPDFRCAYCAEDGKEEDIRAVQIPYVYRYLVVELAAMGVSLSMDVTGGSVAAAGWMVREDAGKQKSTPAM